MMAEEDNEDVPTPEEQSNAPQAFADIFRAEITEICGTRDLPERDGLVDERYGREDSVAETDLAEIRERGYEKRLLGVVEDRNPELAALCLSGGGIRSATFALGVMQGLARFGLLGQFHYLSSVSGGGYIASWLSAWRSVDSDQTVFQSLNQSMSVGREAPQIEAIRADSNYLTPRLGLLSADTWTVLALYLRNLVLNWILFVPFFLGCFFLPRLCHAILTAASQCGPFADTNFWGRVHGLVFLTAGLAVGIYGRFRQQGAWVGKGTFVGLVLAPLILSGISFTLAAVTNFARVEENYGLDALLGALAYLGAWVIGRSLSFRYAAREEKSVDFFDLAAWTASGALVGIFAAVGMNIIATNVHGKLTRSGTHPTVCEIQSPGKSISQAPAASKSLPASSPVSVPGSTGPGPRESATKVRPACSTAQSPCRELDSLCQALVTCLTADLHGNAKPPASAKPTPSQGFAAMGAAFTQDRIQAVTVLGLSGFVTAYLLGELLYVGIASFALKADMDREWLARSSGWLCATAIAWALFSGIALYGPPVTVAIAHALLLVLGGSLLSGGATLTLGWSSLTGANKAAETLKSVSLSQIASAAAVVFATFLAICTSIVDLKLENYAHIYRVSVYIDGIFQLSLAEPAIADTVLMLALIGAAAVLSFFINVNRFSLHALYRNRLVRAFIGSARVKQRHPDPFTGFDPRDNLSMAKVKPKSGTRLFHVINVALNVLSSGKTAWQERKAESFTMTRLACGNPIVGYRPTREFAGARAGGLSLGTAMAISGAAVSPNQGYNSSPLIGFLLMLFNVRLGWWLGNPSGGSYPREGPLFSLTPSLRELVGATRDNSDYIYLSDGGHFENLGLYEMVRRRCRFIFISDAGCDPKFTFEDLGNAVRKIYIDFGVSIEFEKLELQPRQNPPVPGMRFALGRIYYPRLPGTGNSPGTGRLIYVKPTYLADGERADVRSYATAHTDFPHETTTDQWFSESQLESYRALGAAIAEYICHAGARAGAGTVVSEMSLDALWANAVQLLEAFNSAQR